MVNTSHVFVYSSFLDILWIIILVDFVGTRETQNYNVQWFTKFWKECLQILEGMYAAFGRNVCRFWKECLQILEGMYAGFGRNVCRFWKECLQILEGMSAGFGRNVCRFWKECLQILEGMYAGFGRNVCRFCQKQKWNIHENASFPQSKEIGTYKNKWIYSINKVFSAEAYNSSANCETVIYIYV